MQPDQDAKTDLSSEELKELSLSEQTYKELRALAANGKLSGTATDLPPGAKQILAVKSHQLVNASWRRPGDPEVTDAQCVVYLHGCPTLHSDKDLKRACIRVVADNAQIPPPVYNKERGTIFMSIFGRQLPMLLRQLDYPELYCWIGHYGDRNYYADVHTKNPALPTCEPPQAG